MNEMVERVAFHLRAAGGIVNPEENSLILARVAIEAMREPTERMMRQGFDAASSDIGGDWIGKVEVQTTIGSTAWRAMIDEALK